MIFNKRKALNSYRLPIDYKVNKKPSYYTDAPLDNLVYQPHVYELGLYFSDKSKITNIIDIGSGNGLKLIPFLEKGYDVYCIDIGENIKIIKENLSKYKNVTYVECDLSKSFPDIEMQIIKNSIIIAADVIEHIIEVDNFLKWLAKVSYEASYLLVSTPDRDKARGYGDLGIPANLTHIREWNTNEFKLLLKDYSFNSHFIGHTVNTNHHFSKANILVISGTEIAYKRDNKNLESILAIMNVYNEKDIIIETIEHLLTQGLDVYIYDDNSTDGTYDLVEKTYNNSKRVILQKREKISDDYDWENLLKHTEQIANELNYDWFMHCDVDEIRYSPWDDISIQKAVSFINDLGYNAIDFTVLDFRFSQVNIDIQSKFEENLLAFEFGKRAGHFSQIKLWKKQDKSVELHSTGGHEAKFENRKVYPVKFLLKHYPLRNNLQMKNKIFNDRITRIKKEQDEKGWHTQYNEIINQGTIDYLPWQDKHLLYWNNNISKDEFLVELISGIGII